MKSKPPIMISEVRSKIERLKELGDEGFNIPRFCFAISRAPEPIIVEVLNWAGEIYNQNPEQIFNIRTYKRSEKFGKESLGTIHSTDIIFTDLQKELLRLNDQFDCMIDAETPEDGRMAGNVAILDRPFQDAEYVIEFCSKHKRAMVRDADRHISGRLIDFPENFTHHKAGYLYVQEEEILKEVLEKALKFRRKNVILEWTYFYKPAGIKLENIVWWEYRKYG